MRAIDADALIEFCAERWIPLNIDAVNMQPTIQPEKAQLSKEGTTKDTISRQQAIDAINSWRGRFSEEYNEAIDDCENSIIELPTIQPEPKEGHWIWVAGELMCSECRTIYSDLYPDYDNAVACPHCGAKMINK